jgi:16S rRNA C967 or C1407 C5-methylase (RsmB/RsmF family)
MKQESRAHNLSDTDFFGRVSKLLESDAECQLFLEALDSLSKSPMRALRTNRLRPRAKEEFTFLSLTKPVPWAREHGLLTAAALETLKKTPHIGAGLAYIQDPAALEPPQLLNPQPEEFILDLCAAPGGKASYLSELMGEGTGWLFANDVDRKRALTLSQLCARQGSPRISVHNERPQKLAELLAGALHAVLLDAPCSGESFFAKRKETRKDVLDREVERLQRTQLELLHCAQRCLIPGLGRIVYSTCTYSREENEDVVERFLAEHPEMELAQSQRRWPHRDQVPGGFVALLRFRERTPTESPLASQDFSAQFLPEHPMAQASLVRWGLCDYQGIVDPYAQAMSASAQGSPLPAIEVSEPEAMAFLRGESLSTRAEFARGEVIVRWKGYALGTAKVLADRVNNHLPKSLRLL